MADPMQMPFHMVYVSVCSVQMYSKSQFHVLRDIYKPDEKPKTNRIDQFRFQFDTVVDLSAHVHKLQLDKTKLIAVSGWLLMVSHLTDVDDVVIIFVFYDLCKFRHSSQKSANRTTTAQQ